MSDPQPLDVFALLDEVQAIARTGLHFSEDPFDRERYTKLLDTAQRQYAAHTTLDRSDIRERFEAELGYVTAKVGVDAAVFDDQDRILLARRVDDDKWGLIAGWVDPNESPEQTAVRELAEEVGVQARVDRLVGVFFREARAGQHPHGTVSIVYLCTITAGRPRPQPHEIRELAWRVVDEVHADEWHHHHELLARAALEAHWRSRAGL